MPRGGGRSGGGRSGFGGGRSRSRSPTPTRSAGTFSQAPKQHVASTAQPVRTGGGMFSGLGGMFLGGMALGSGSEIGHRAMNSMMGGGRDQVQPYESQAQQEGAQTYNQQNPCQTENEKFIECIKNNSDSISICQNYLDDVKSCEKRIKGVL